MILAGSISRSLDRRRRRWSCRRVTVATSQPAALAWAPDHATPDTNSVAPPMGVAPSPSALPSPPHVAPFPLGVDRFPPPALTLPPRRVQHLPLWTRTRRMYRALIRSCVCLPVSVPRAAEEVRPRGRSRRRSTSGGATDGVTGAAGEPSASFRVSCTGGKLFPGLLNRRFLSCPLRPPPSLGTLAPAIAQLRQSALLCAAFGRALAAQKLVRLHRIRHNPCLGFMSGTGKCKTPEKRVVSRS